MDTKTFIIELVNVTIWPVLLLTFLITLRKPLSELVPYLKRLKLGELEADFEKTIASIKDTVDDIAIKEKHADTEKENLYRLAEIAPNAAILEAWKNVEWSARKLIAAKGYHPDYEVAFPYKLIEKIFLKENLIETKKLKVFNELRNLRNKIAHAREFQISTVQAKEYIYLSLSLNEYFENMLTA